MILEKLSTHHIESISILCQYLKTHDEHPCSFWGYSAESLHKLFQDPHPKDPNALEQVALVAIIDQMVIGIGTLNPGGPFQNHWAEISVATHPQFRKKGAGKKLVSALEEYRKKFNFEFFKALILENNKPSRDFFSRLGYQHKATLYQDFKIETSKGLFENISDCAYYKIFPKDSVY